MKRTLLVIFLAALVMSLAGTSAVACGEKKTDAEKASTDTKAEAQVASSKAKICPVAAAAKVCDASDKTSETAMVSAHDGEGPFRTMSIKGMTCAGSEKTISAALAEVPGVIEVVKVCHESGEAVVRIDPASAKDELLTTAVINKGYEAKIIPAVARTTEPSSKGKICPLSGGPACAEKAPKASTEKKPDETE